MCTIYVHAKEAGALKEQPTPGIVAMSIKFTYALSIYHGSTVSKNHFEFWALLYQTDATKLS